MPLLPQAYSASAAEAPINGGRRASAEDFSGGDLSAGAHKLRTAAHAYLQDAEENESRKALIASSEIRAKYARELDQAALDGRDLGKLKEQMSAELVKTGEGFQTKKGQESLQLYTANSELMYDEQANRINVQRASEQARVDGHKFLTSAGAIIQSNPLYLQEAEKNAEALANTFQNIPSWKRQEIADGLKKELNLGAAIASARINPEQTRKELDSGKWDLTPAQRTHAIDKADTEIRARRAEDAYLEAQAEKERMRRNEDAYDKQFKSIMDGSATRRTIMDDADLRPQTREHLIVFMEHRAKEMAGQEKKSDPITLKNIWLAANAPTDDPTRVFNTNMVFDAVQAGLINTTDAERANSWIANRKDENNRSFSTRLQGRIQTIAAAMRTSPVYQAQPELAAAIQLELVSRAEKAVVALRKDGANGKDPETLLDPDSANYLFKPNLIKSVADDVQRQQQALLPQATTVNSKEEYDKLEPGTPYIDSKGQRGIKKGAAVKPAPFRPSGER